MARHPWALVSVGLLSLVLLADADAQFRLGRTKQSVVEQFDRNGDGWLNAEERTAARRALGGAPADQRRWGGEFSSGTPPTASSLRLTPVSVPHYHQEGLYDLPVLRTIFLEFQENDWERELADFYRTDIDVPATATVDGTLFQNVGVHFRGQTSFQMVSAGHKRSMDLNFDLVDKKQRLVGIRKIELLNAAADPTFLRTALYLHIMRAYLPAPRANYMRLVINGEYWGVYVNEEHLTQEFVTAAGGNVQSMRWKIPGSPRGRGGLEYWGEDPAPYQGVFEIKSKDDPASWRALIRMCKALNTTPPARLQAALAPLLDVDGALRFLAVEKALINNDGYWTRASDYSLYTDAQGRFHVAPHDANETLRPTEMMGGMFFGRTASAEPDSAQLDPLTGAEDTDKPLLNRLLAVPELRERYLGYVRDVADKWLNWDTLGPLAQRYQAVIAADVARDPRKLFSTESFSRAVTEDNATDDYGGPIAAPDLSLKHFAEQRRTYLLHRLPVPSTR